MCDWHRAGLTLFLLRTIRRAVKPSIHPKGLAFGRVVAVGLAELVNEPMEFLQILTLRLVSSTTGE